MLYIMYRFDHNVHNVHGLLICPIHYVQNVHNVQSSHAEFVYIELFKSNHKSSLKQGWQGKP